MRMLAAAAEAIDEVGYGSFTVAHVIARAKVSRKTFYDAFGDREDCFIELLDRVAADVEARMGDAYGSESSWREGTRAGLAELLTFIDEEPVLARVCIVHAIGGGRRVLERRAEVLAQLRDVIDRGRALGVRAGEPPRVAAEGVLGGVFAVLHTRLLEGSSEPFSELLGPLMSTIVLPYLGSRAASRELSRPAPHRRARRAGGQSVSRDPLEGLEMRLTYRTMRVLTAIKERPGASNREIAQRAGVVDPGQMSKLLARLERLALIENTGDGRSKGGSNEWRLTERGERVVRAAHTGAQIHASHSPIDTEQVE